MMPVPTLEFETRRKKENIGFREELEDAPL